MTWRHASDVLVGWRWHRGATTILIGVTERGERGGGRREREREIGEGGGRGRERRGWVRGGNGGHDDTDDPMRRRGGGEEKEDEIVTVSRY